jgi:hypothetical protein
VSSATRRIKNTRSIERIADAVLYEGYILYPYRPSAVKNQQRWNFGVLSPEAYAVAQRGTESSSMLTECLVETDSASTLEVKIHFLHLMLRELAEEIEDCPSSRSDPGHIHEGSAQFRVVPAFEFNGQILQTWQEAVQREVVIPRIKLNGLGLSKRVKFEFPSSQTTEPLMPTESGKRCGLILRTQEAIAGEVEIAATTVVLDSVSPDETAKKQLVKLSIEIRNLTPFENASGRSRDEALLHSFVSTHTILEVDNGAFVSLLDPPDEYKSVAHACTNTRTYPVLVGDEGDHKFMLSSPIILYDYPQIAEESAGDLFDGTEIDEILTLRIMSMTDEEKREMRGADVLARQLLERTESLSPEQMMSLHGVMKKA